MNDLHVETIGSANEHLVVLHGWGQSLQNMQPLGELLAPYRRVHLIDLPGFGASLSPAQVWSSFDFADRILKYLDEQQIEKCSLLGHSFGGKVAMSFALRYPNRIDQLILMGASGLKRKRTFKENLRFKTIRLLGSSLKQIDKTTGSQFFQKWFAPKFGSADYKSASPLLRAILVKSVNEDLSTQVSDITAPTLLMWGRNDQETPLELGERLEKSLPNAQLLVFDGKGHYLHQDCGAHLCAYHIIPFLCKTSME